MLIHVCLVLVQLVDKHQQNIWYGFVNIHNGDVSC